MDIAVKSLERKVTELRRQLADSQKAHELALTALEKSREAKKKAKAQTKHKVTRSKADLVEVICSDVHGGQMDLAAVGAFLDDLKRIKPDRLVLNGDILDCSGFVSSHCDLYLATTEQSYEDDVLAANTFLDQIDAIIPPHCEVHYLEGNHESRVERYVVSQGFRNAKDAEFLRRQIAPETVLRIKERGYKYYRWNVVTDSHYLPCWVTLDGLQFSHVPPSVGQNSCASSLNRIADCAVFSHTHRQDYMPTVTAGEHGAKIKAAWNTGCLCQRQPIWQATRPSNWTHGYLVRLIHKATKTWQMIPVLIEDGRSLGGEIFKDR